MRSQILLLGTFLGLAACGDGALDVISGPTPRGGLVTTDSSEYHLTPVTGGMAGQVSVSFTNLLPTAVYFERCFPKDARPMYDIVRAGPDSLTPLDLRYVWACVGGASTGTIKPGQSVALSVDVTTFDDPGSPSPVEERTGSMKVRLRLCQEYRRESSDCEPIDLDYRESNLFTLHPPDVAGTLRTPPE